MGLDMYAYVTAEPIEADTDFKLDWNRASLIFQWRKHPNLHGWMEQLYRDKGGAEPEFNLVTLALDEADLAALETDVIQGCLPETVGFFFGMSDGSEREEDLEFIASAREAIRAGASVFYHSWW